MLADVPRETFLALCRIRSSTLDQRTRVHEAALALGCERTARVGWYLLLDCVAMILASVLNHFTGLQLRQAADVVREQWKGWLELVTKAERWHEKYPTTDPMLCIAIAWLSFEEGQSQRRYRVLLGDHHEIDRALAGESIYTVNFVSIARVLHALRDNARLADFTLPARLTVAEGEPGYDNWRDEIRAYQERAGARVIKTKPLTPA
jgi:hypothetical protein